MKTLRQIRTEVYDPKSGDEKRFKKKHVVAKTNDVNGNDDEVFNASNVKTIDRKSENHGYDNEEGEKVYEDTTTKLLTLYANLNDDNKEIFEALHEGGFQEDLLLMAEEINSLETV
ncbi:MAG: hypothetical protein EBY41_00075 [Proteobacteria bacterium]|jgi:hypothetical protein|nr:hypothetical protein [Pseudomonadota bacterium]